jgi:predicted nuclease of predicted toxin-antitoxin system
VWVPELKFIADMDISPLTVSRLKKYGWKIQRVNEIMDVRSRDIDILDHAGSQNSVVITHDLDYSELLAIYGYEKPSVISLRLFDMSPDFVTNRIIEIVSQLEKELEQGIVVSVDDTSAKFRDLPIR